MRGKVHILTRFDHEFRHLLRRIRAVPGRRKPRPIAKFVTELPEMRGVDVQNSRYVRKILWAEQAPVYRKSVG